jgi:MFS family permease
MAKTNTKLKPSRAVAMWIVAVELAIVFAGSTLPTPLYLLYRRAFGFSEVALTLIFAVYVVGNVVALFIFGRLSDQIGRRKATLPALGISVVSTVVFIFAGSTSWLFVARVLSGFATGLAAGTATAWIAELYPRGDKTAAAVMAAAANLAGLALGPLIAGLLAQYAPWPSAFGIFSLIGFYSALAPSLLTESLHQSSAAVSGSIVFELFIVAAVSAMAMRTLESRTAMLSGLATLLPSLALLVVAQAIRSMPFLTLATALTGVSAALGYCGSLQVVNQISPADKRSKVVSSYLIACYIGNSVPVMGIGLFSQIANSMTAHAIFAAVIGAFAVVGLVTGVKYAPEQ